MVEIKESTIIKKAPAKKAPAVKKAQTPEEVEMLLKAKYAVEGRQVTEEEIKKEAKERLGVKNYIAEEAEASLDVESMTLEHQDNIITILDGLAQIRENAKQQEVRTNSMIEKNDKLSDKLTFVSDANVTIMFPNHLIESIINEQIKKVNNKLMDSIDEADGIIEELTSEDVEEALKQVSRINDLKNRLCDLEENTSRLGELDYDIESAVNNELDNKDYLSEYDIIDKINDAIEDNEAGYYKSLKDIEELKRQVKGLLHIIDNKERRSLLNRFIKLWNKFSKWLVSNKLRLFKSRTNQ